MTREEQMRKAAIRAADNSNEFFLFTRGVKWADENPKEGLVSIDKACEWLKNSLYDTQDNCGYKVVASFDSVDVNEFINDFKRAMQE